MKTFEQWTKLSGWNNPRTSSQSLRPREELWYQEYFLWSGVPRRIVGDMTNRAWSLPDSYAGFPGGVLDGVCDTNSPYYLEGWVEYNNQSGVVL